MKIHCFSSGRPAGNAKHPSHCSGKIAPSVLVVGVLFEDLTSCFFVVAPDTTPDLFILLPNAVFALFPFCPNGSSEFFELFPDVVFALVPFCPHGMPEFLK